MPKKMVNNTPPASQQKSIAMSADASQPIGATTMKEKLFPSAILSNAERNELHQQIYTYFAWLNENMVTADNSGQKAKEQYWFGYNWNQKYTNINGGRIGRQNTNTQKSCRGSFKE